MTTLLEKLTSTKRKLTFDDDIEDEISDYLEPLDGSQEIPETDDKEAVNWMPNLDEEDWRDYFPMSEYRQWQEWAINNILKGWQSGKKYAIVEGPCGSGKSVYAITLGLLFKNTYIATPQKILQAQYMNDFGSDLFELKGKANYPCLRINHKPWTIKLGTYSKQLIKGKWKRVEDTVESTPVEGQDYISLETWNSVDQDHIFRKHNCGNAPCSVSSRGKEMRAECKKAYCCEYIKRRDFAFNTARFSLMNFSNLLCFSYLMPQVYKKRPLLILDECHLLERVLYEFATIHLLIKQLKPIARFIPTEGLVKYEDQILEHSVIPDEMDPDEMLMEGLAALQILADPFESVEQFCDYIEDIILPGCVRYLKTKTVITEVEDDEIQASDNVIKDEFLTDLEDERTRIQSLRDRLTALLKEEPTDHSHVLVPTTKEEGQETVVIGIQIIPFSVARLGPSLAFRSSCSRVLLMSATILDPTTYCKSVGIPKEEAFFIRVPSTFPPENRLIIGNMSVGSMGYNHKDKTLPKMMNAILEITSKHSDHKGIIHTANYENMMYLQRWVKQGHPELKERLLFQAQRTFEEKNMILHHHFSSQEPTILCGPGLVEGINLYDDLARFNVLMKLPFLSLANPLIKRKSEEFPEWYALQVALSIIQALGRSVRSITDWSVIYILDLLWQFFYDKNKNILFPKDIQEAVRWVSAKYPIPFRR